MSVRIRTHRDAQAENLFSRALAHGEIFCLIENL